MRMIKVLLLLIFSTFLINCSDKDDNNDYNFNAETLYQTVWEGEMLEIDGEEIISSTKILMQFFTLNGGEIIRTYINPENGEPVSQVDEFSYSIEGEVMNIKKGPLPDRLMILEATKDKMEFVAFSHYKVTLTLQKKILK